MTALCAKQRMISRGIQPDHKPCYRKTDKYPGMNPIPLAGPEIQVYFIRNDHIARSPRTCAGPADLRELLFRSPSADNAGR